MRELSEKKIVLTGASRGIGLALARALAKERTQLVLVSRKFESSIVSDLKKLGAQSVECISADLSDSKSLEELVLKIQKDSPDVLINNAGLLTGGLLEKQSWPEIQSMMAVNVNALMRLTQALLPSMLARKSGLIVNNASVSGVMNLPCASTYSASKAAVVAFTRCLQVELVGTGVETLLLLTPGVQTDMFNQIEDKFGEHMNVSELGRMGADSYAEQVVAAIKSGKSELSPAGFQGLGLRLAQHAPMIFSWGAGKAFRRS